MSAEVPVINLTPEASQEAASFMNVARNVFASYKDNHEGKPIPFDKLAIVKIDGAKLPLYVIGEAGKFLSGEISVHPDSTPDRVVITSSVKPITFGGSVVAKFGNLNRERFFSAFGELSMYCFSAPQYSDLDGRGGMGQGFVAVIRDGKLDLNRLENQTIKSCVVFAGIHGKTFYRGVNAWHGFVIID